MTSRRLFIWSLLTSGLLSACALPPTRVGEGVAQHLGEEQAGFDVSARFSLQYTPPMAEAKSFTGQLQWQHNLSGDRLFFADPLGQGVAELWRPAQGMVSLVMADGSRREAADADLLLGDLLGAPLPLVEMSSWIRALPGDGALVEPDAQGRPRRMRESGWLLTYQYADEAALPSRLDASLDGVVKLRLAFERWEALP